MPRISNSNTTICCGRWVEAKSGDNCYVPQVDLKLR